MDSSERRVARRLGDLVRVARRARGWSQAELAEAVDVSFGFVGLLERGARLPSVPTLVHLAKALELDLRHLTEDRSPNAEEWADDALARLRALTPDQRRVAIAMLGGLHALTSHATGRPASRRRG